MLSQRTGPTYYARLQFEDVASCVAWLESIPLDDVIEAHEMVSAQIGLTTRAELPAIERLRIFEVLYQTAMHLQAELARAFVGRALPHSIVEYSVWMSVLELWHVMYKGYQACLRRYLRGDQTLTPHGPLLALRCVELTAAAIREHHQVYREVAPTLWRQLHECYAIAEREGLHTAGIADPLRPGMPTRTAAGAYARCLLAHQANPYAMSLRQMQFIYRWTELWESLVVFGASPHAPGIAPVLAVDLKSGAAAGSARQFDAGPNVRYIGLEQLAQAVRRTIALLRQGEDPASLGLGDDCRQPGCEQFLTLLYIQWCGTGIGPFTAPGRERGEDIRACVGLRGILRQLASDSEAFRAPGRSVGTAFGPYTEHWNIVSVSAPGFIGVARGPECDERLEHHQLVAIKRRNVASFQMGVVQWLKLESDGDLSIGLRMLPGAPHVTAIRPTDTESLPAHAETGILLPAAVEKRMPASLLLAKDVFRPGREIDLMSGTARRVRLVRLIERGVDFERAAFELIA